jgi:acetyl esterase/lipase
LISAISADAQNSMRYLDDVFTNVTVTSDVQFAENISILPAILSGGANPPSLVPIICDIYEPIGDNLTDRPVVILAHTGSFLPQVINGQPTGDKTDFSIAEQCTRWAKKGYVAVAMDNRLGWNPTSTDQDVRTSSLLQAAYRGIQDAKAMVRFMRMTEDNGNPYGIDPNKIVLGGQGTGAYIALGYATLDDESKTKLCV